MIINVSPDIAVRLFSLGSVLYILKNNSINYNKDVFLTEDNCNSYSLGGLYAAKHYIIKNHNADDGNSFILNMHNNIGIYIMNPTLICFEKIQIEKLQLDIITSIDEIEYRLLTDRSDLMLVDILHIIQRDNSLNTKCMIKKFLRASNPDIKYFVEYSENTKINNVYKENGDLMSIDINMIESNDLIISV